MVLPLSRDSPALAQLRAHLDHQDFWRHCLLLVAGLRCGQPWESPSAALAPQVVLLRNHQLQSSEEQDSLEVMPLPRDSRPTWTTRFSAGCCCWLCELMLPAVLARCPLTCERRHRGGRDVRASVRHRITAAPGIVFAVGGRDACASVRHRITAATAFVFTVGQPLWVPMSMAA